VLKWKGIFVRIDEKEKMWRIETIKYIKWDNLYANIRKRELERYSYDSSYTSK
jgi:hypothetical protein